MSLQHVRFDGNPDLPFNPDLIDKIEVKSPITGEWEDSEHWGWEDKPRHYDFGRIGSALHFEIYENHIQFYSGTGITVLVKQDDYKQVCFTGQSDWDQEVWYQEQNYWPHQVQDNYPETMGEFLEAVETFIVFVLRGMEDIRQIHIHLPKA